MGTSPPFYVFVQTILRGKCSFSSNCLKNFQSVLTRLTELNPSQRFGLPLRLVWGIPPLLHLFVSDNFMWQIFLFTLFSAKFYEFSVIHLPKPGAAGGNLSSLWFLCVLSEMVSISILVYKRPSDRSPPPHLRQVFPPILLTKGSCKKNNSFTNGQAIKALPPRPPPA